MDLASEFIFERAPILAGSRDYKKLLFAGVWQQVGALLQGISLAHLPLNWSNVVLCKSAAPVIRNVRSTSLPPVSQLHSRVSPDDFLDCYAVASTLSPRQAAEIALTFPAWTRALLWLRNVLVAPFGLAGEGESTAEKIGIFPLQSESDSELIAGFNDKHLDFRISVLAEAGFIFLATWVHPHNVGGRLYLAAIMPFHVLIVRDGLRRVGASQDSRKE